MHQAGDQPRLYYGARSTKHQDLLAGSDNRDRAFTVTN